MSNQRVWQRLPDSRSPLPASRFPRVVHLQIPDFGTAIEQLRRPELKRAPLVLALMGERAVVQGVNGLARREGIREGMPLFVARRLCRRVQVLPPDFSQYREKHLEIVGAFESSSPLVEGSAPGSYFIDITGTRRLFGPGPDLACRMEKELGRKMGLRARIGLAANKLVSQVAARCTEPGNLSYIFPGNEEAFLSPLPVDFLPGVGEVTTAKLAGFNILTTGQLASFPVDMLAAVFGRSAERLLSIAKGVDTTPVLVSRKVPRIAVAKILDRDEIDPGRLETALFGQVEEAGWDLRRLNRFPGAFRLEIRYADGMSVDTGNRLPPWAIQADRSLFQSVLSAFYRLFRRRVAVRRMVIEFSDLVMPATQLSLFTWENGRTSKERALQEALDAIRAKFGKESISWARGLR
ncbi:MAG: DNA polymerase Y family protein [Syntrophobacteraceae bacterium]